MSRGMTKPTKWVCAQRRLRSAWASAQSDQSSLCAQWIAKDPRGLHADSEDYDQTGRMTRLIWVFAGRTGHFVGFVMSRLIYTCLVNCMYNCTCYTCKASHGPLGCKICLTMLNVIYVLAFGKICSLLIGRFFVKITVKFSDWWNRIYTWYQFFKI